MKKITLTVIMVLTLSNIALSRELPLSYIPKDHHLLVHINTKKILSPINPEGFERVLLRLASSVLSSREYNEFEKVFKQFLPALKNAGFDIYNDLSSIVFSGNTEGGNKSFLMQVKGNFTDEAFTFFCSNILKLKRISKGKYRQADLRIQLIGNHTILAAGSDKELAKALKAKETGSNILTNPKFAAIYAKSVKNKAINFIAALSMDQPARMRNSQYRRRGGAFGSLMMFLTQIDGANISIDGPTFLSMHARVFCKTPNTAAMLGNLIQQQFQLMPQTIAGELARVNRTIAYLQKKANTSPRYKKRLFLQRHAKAAILISQYGAKKYRVITMGKNLYFDFYWPRNIIEDAMRKAGLDYTLQDILR